MVAPLIAAGLGIKFASDALTPDSTSEINSRFSAGKMTFPPGGFGGTTHRGMLIPVALNFKADTYKNKQMFRDNAIKGELADITLPLAMSLSDNTLSLIHI